MDIDSNIVGGPAAQFAQWGGNTRTGNIETYTGTDIGSAPLNCGALAPVVLTNTFNFTGNGFGDLCDASGSTVTVDF